MGHQWSTAEQLDTADTLQYTNAYSFYEGENQNEGEWLDPVVDPPPGMTGVLQGWRRFTPSQHEIVFLRATAPNETNVTFGVWSRVNGVWGKVQPPLPFAPDLAAFVELDGGVTYYVMFADESVDSFSGGIGWSAYLYQEFPYDTVDVPPVAIDVRPHGSPPGEEDTIDVPPVALSVALGEPRPFDGYLVPAITAATTITADLISFLGTITLATPADGETVAISRPTLTVAVDTDDPEQTYTAEIQYATDAAFTAPTSITQAFDGADGGLVTTPATALADGPYWWRARLTTDGTPISAWTAAQCFTVDLVTASRALPVSWTVAATADRPIHMWHLDPPGPEAGDTITIYGQGLPATGSLLYGDLVLPTTSWTRVAATDDNTDAAARLIDGSTVTCEHYEVQFVAPADDGPGAALTLEA